MKMTGKISPINKRMVGDYFPQDTIAGSLQRHGARGLTRAPRTVLIMSPAKNRDGSYRTGLDVDAAYLKQLPEEERAQEIERIKGYLELAKQYYPDIDIENPRSSFWRDMVRHKGNASVAPFANLIDDDNLFDLSVPEQLITYCYLRVHPYIASSGSKVLSGEYHNQARYYVNDSDIETQAAYKIKSRISKAIAKFEKLSPTKRKIIARQLGFNVSDSTLDEAVYVMITDYINEAASVKKQGNIELFDLFSNMDDQNLKIRDTIKQGITFNVLRKSRGNIYRGDVRLGSSEQDVAEFLSNPKNQEDLLGIEAELKTKKSINA